MSLIASIDPVTLQVEAGGQAVVVVRVRNRGTIVERFEIGVVGPAAAWAHAEPDALRLFPDVEGTAQVIFHPPKAASPQADTYPFGISIRPAADPDSSTVEEGRVTVAPFVELLTEVVPQTSRGSRSGRHTVTIKNQGNSVAEITAKATDPDRLLLIDLEPARFGLEAGGSRAVRTRVKPVATFFTGSPNRIPFAVQVDERISGSREIPASFEQRPILPGWLKPVFGLGVAGVLALLLLPRLLGLTGAGGTAQTTDPPKSTPVMTPVATVAASQAPSAVAPSAEVTPTPMPTPGELVIAVTGDNIELQGLSLRCPATDQACRDRAGGAIEVIIGQLLLGPYEGGGLFRTEDVDPQTLPVLGTWQGPFPYKAVGGDEQGTTSKVAIDLAPLLAQNPGSAYAVVEDLDGLRHRYVIPAGAATALKDILYLVSPQMEPDATPAPDPNPRDRVFNEGLVLRDFFEASPSP